MVGRLQRVGLREVWKHEALDFTTWLLENYDLLNDVMDISLTNIEREQAAGSFSVDLVGEDEDGYPVVIENQLEKSDHDHLGKLITYLSSFDAKTAIWIVAEPRPEHVTAVTWLNESTAASFYLIKMEAIRIQDPGSDNLSTAAPLLTLIVGPSEASREVGERKKEWAEREILRHRFWKELLEKAKLRTQLHANISPSRDTWISAGAGKSGLIFMYVVNQHNARVVFSIERRPPELNKVTFDALTEHQNVIEHEFDGTLVWDRMDNKLSSRIFSVIESGGYRDDNWDEIHHEMIDGMIRLERSLRPYLQDLPQ